MSLDPNGLLLIQRDQQNQRLPYQPQECQNLTTNEKNLYKRIFDSLTAIVFIKDKNNRLIEFNKTFEEFVRIPREQLLGKSIPELFADAEKNRGDDREVVETGKSKLNIIEEVIVAGNVLWLKTDKIPLTNDNNDIIGVLGISQDITQQKIMEDKLAATEEKLRDLNNELEEGAKAKTKELLESNEELKRINADLDNFIYIASHDLKSPIDNIDGFVHFLKESLKNKTTPDEEKVFDRINASVERFRKTIAELRKITKVQRNFEDSIEEVDLNEIIEDIKTEIFFTIQKANARIITSFDVPVIKYGKKNIRSILYNLISNAINYRSPKRKPIVKVSTKQNEQGVLLSVEDNGLGLAPDEKDKLFIMFKRLHDHVEGTGVGLYIVKRTVENNGGKIEVESEKGKSTVFKILIKKSTKHVAV
jgi:PAS domain S-box-containing protein